MSIITVSVFGVFFLGLAAVIVVMKSEVSEALPAISDDMASSDPSTLGADHYAFDQSKLKIDWDPYLADTYSDADNTDPTNALDC